MTNFYQYLYHIDPSRINRSEAIDAIVAPLIDTTSLSYYSYQLRKITEKPNFFPKLIAAVNTLYRKVIENPAQNNNELYAINGFAAILETETNELLISKWLSDQLDKFHISRPDQHCHNISSEYRIKVFKKILDRVKSKRNHHDIRGVEEIFKIIPSENLAECCEELSLTTPSIQASLLARGDIDEKYMLTGLRAISKLKTQRRPVNVDFYALRRLGPKGRLEAVKQLMGYSRYGYKYKDLDSVPFAVKPTVDEFKEFLFPCSMKFNEEVSALCSKYEELFKVYNKDQTTP